MAHIGTMSKHANEELSDRRLKYLMELADECLPIAAGYRLRLARSNTMLMRLVCAIDANPALRFTMTADERGACWIDIRLLETSSVPGAAKHPASQPPRTHIVA